MEPEMLYKAVAGVTYGAMIIFFYHTIWLPDDPDCRPARGRGQGTCKDCYNCNQRTDAAAWGACKWQQLLLVEGCKIKCGGGVTYIK